MSQGGAVGKVLDKKVTRSGRLTAWSIPWLVLIAICAVLAVPYEIYCIATGRDGGPLTHVVKWAYGPQLGLRWWLLGCGFFGWSAWLAPHFMFNNFGLRALLALVGLGLAVGVAGWLLTR
jgi:hypothetical protein